jgi:hypothetical protein
MTYQMEEAAELLAMGKYKSHVAKRLNVNAATLWKWMQEPEFIAYANAVRDGLRETTVMEIAATIKEALAIDSDVLAGTMPADDPRAIRAADITRHAYRAWAVQPKPDEWADGRTERHYRR